MPGQELHVAGQLFHVLRTILVAQIEPKEACLHHVKPYLCDSQELALCVGA